MRRGLRLVSLALLPLFTSACFTVTAYAPDADDIRLLGPDAEASVAVEYKAWYLFWGLLQVSSKTPADVIAEHNLEEARFATQDKTDDVLIGVAMGIAGLFIGLLNGIIPMPQTIKVYGNPAATAELQPEAAPAQLVQSD